jgi:hypothetical protein
MFIVKTSTMTQALIAEFHLASQGSYVRNPYEAKDKFPGADMDIIKYLFVETMKKDSPSQTRWTNFARVLREVYIHEEIQQGIKSGRASFMLYDTHPLDVYWTNLRNSGVV